MKSERRLKCRWCDYTTMLWFTRKNKKVSNPEKAFARLRDHVIEKHPEEAKKIYKGHQWYE